MPNVIIKAPKDGPQLVEADKKTSVILCRCGRSQTQSSCDGTHVTTGFKAEKSKIKITE